VRNCRNGTRKRRFIFRESPVKRLSFIEFVHLMVDPEAEIAFDFRVRSKAGMKGRAIRARRREGLV
jgi:hypothetical protein